MGHPAELVALGKSVFFLTIILLLLSWAAVALRLWVRLAITKSPGWDDATMVFALCLFTCYCAFILVITLGAAPDRSFTINEILKSLVYVQLSEVFYILTTTFLKVSLGLFFLRVLTQPWQRNLFHTILAISAVYGAFYFLVTIFQCGNPAKLADSLLGARNCAPSWFLLTTGYFYGIINVISDWTFTLIPIVILLDSDIDLRSKISVSIVMGFAAIGSIASIMRMVYLKALLFNVSVTPNAIRATLWATAEPGTGIIAASGAILRPLFRQIASDVRDKVSHYASSKTARTAHSDGESVIGLTSVPPSRSVDGRKSKSLYSVNLEDNSEERMSLEHAQVGIGRAISIRAARGMDFKPVPPPKP